MPTGFTAFLENEDMTFPEFAWLCARAMGALVLMRDEALDAPIPKKFFPDDYHEKELSKAKQELSELESSPWKSESKAENLYYAALCEYRKRAERNERQRRLYERMMLLVENWNPPTPEHEGLKKFMLDQLNSSVQFDCHDGEEPKKLTGEQWMRKEMDRLNGDIEYHKKKIAEERRRCDERNAWLNALRASIGNPPKERERL